MTKTNINLAKLCGEIKSCIVSHVCKGEEMQSGQMEIVRASGVVDTIPFEISSRKITADFKPGANVLARGNFRSRDKNGKLGVFFHINTYETTDEDASNQIELEGFICTRPFYKVTAYGKSIAEFILANNEMERANYLPVICWNEYADIIKDMKPGTKVRLHGRIQSRVYAKRSESGITYGKSIEVSAYSIMEVKTE